MNAVSFPPPAAPDEDDLDEDVLDEDHLDEDDLEESPATQRAPASGLVQLIARTRPDADVDDVTISRAPSVQAIARAAGADDGDAIALMRDLYACGDIERALAVARAIQAATPHADTRDRVSGGDAEDPCLGGLLFDEELAVEDASIEEMVSAFLERDASI